MPLPPYEESSLALLENTNTDAKLPIILRKLEEVDEGQGIRLDEEKMLYGLDIEANGEPVQNETQDKAGQDIQLPSDSTGNAKQMDQMKVANQSARRTEK